MSRQVVFSKSFQKRFVKMPKSAQGSFERKLELFLENEFEPTLHNHKLNGEYSKYRSISITGDYRAHYRLVDGGYYFSAIGTHSELYE